MAKKSIMVADDLSERTTEGRLRSRLIRESAIELAKKLEFDIDLLYVKNLSPNLLNKNQVQALEESFDDIANAAMSQFKKNSIKGRMHLRAGLPAEEILQFAKISSEAEIMVLGTHGKKGLKKMLLGSVAEEVLRQSSIPVMVLGPSVQSAEKALKLKKDSEILFLTDLTRSSAPAEEFALQLSEKLNCPLTALHCVGDQIMKTRTTLYGSGYAPFDLDNMFAELIKDAQSSLKSKAALWEKKGFNVTTVLNSEEEAVEKTLFKEARKGYSLIVMGTHGRNKFLTAFLGSTARRAIISSPVPVVVVRSK